MGIAIMTGKKSVYLEEYLAIHNRVLETHPCYSPDMAFTQVDAIGNLCFNTKDEVINSGDLQVCNEVAKQVEKTHALIIV